MSPPANHLVDPVRKKRGSLIPVVAVIAMLSTIGAIGASVAYSNNSARAARFDADPGCQAPLNRAVPTTPPSACSNDDALVVAQYVHTLKSSRYYRLALRTSDGVVDSIEIQRRPAKALWASAPVGTTARVQRFTEPGSAKRHVTGVRVNDLSTLTEWNPTWQRGNTEMGIAFLSIIAGASVIALIVMRRRAAADLGKPAV